MNPYNLSVIRKERLSELFALLPFFENPESDFGEGPSIDDRVVSPSIFSDEVARFEQLCYQLNLVQPFDWQEWAEANRNLVEEGAGLEEAGLETLGKLLTTYIRGNRFCDGWLLGVMREGRIAGVLRRMEELAG